MQNTEGFNFVICTNIESYNIHISKVFNLLIADLRAYLYLWRQHCELQYCRMTVIYAVKTYSVRNEGLGIQQQRHAFSI